VKTLIQSAAILALTAPAAFAQGVPPVFGPGIGKNNAVAVPEISALEGTAALAAVAAIVLLAWERRRRAS
jgi:hypothetical protein